MDFFTKPNFLLVICTLFSVSNLSTTYKIPEELGKDFLKVESPMNETIFFFDFDNYDEAIANGFLHIGSGTRYVNFFQTYDFTPDSTSAEIISITDVTSIMTPTLDDKRCPTPFELEGKENYFCVPDSNTPGTYQCNASDEISSCNLGYFMMFKKGTRPPTSQFIAQLQFDDFIELETDVVYEFKFSYMLHYDTCDPNDVHFKIYLDDLNLVHEILFDSLTSDNSSNVSNRKWNEFKQCFSVYERAYTLFVNATSDCTVAGSNPFIAIDQISLRELSNEEAQSLACLDIRISEAPEIEVETTQEPDMKTTGAENSTWPGEETDVISSDSTTISTSLAPTQDTQSSSTSTQPTTEATSTSEVTASSTTSTVSDQTTSSSSSTSTLSTQSSSGQDTSSTSISTTTSTDVTDSTSTSSLNPSTSTDVTSDSTSSTSSGSLTSASLTSGSSMTSITTGSSSPAATTSSSSVAPTTEENPGSKSGVLMPYWALGVIGAVLLVLVIALIVVIVIKRNEKGRLVYP